MKWIDGLMDGWMNGQRKGLGKIPRRVSWAAGGYERLAGMLGQVQSAFAETQVALMGLLLSGAQGMSLMGLLLNLASRMPWGVFRGVSMAGEGSDSPTCLCIRSAYRSSESSQCGFGPVLDGGAF